MKRQVPLLLLVFMLALAVRIIITLATPENDTWIDLTIYQDSGKLVANGVNPFDPADNTPLREAMREHRKSTNSWLAETPERWHYYVSGNLPLTLLFYGLVEEIANGDSVVFRIIFAVFDSILAVLIFAYISKNWEWSSETKITLALGLSAFSPVLLYAGTLYPQDKGVQTLLMVGALLLSRGRSFVPAAVLLGMSIAFKGLGVFIAPLCLYYMLGSPQHISEVLRRDVLMRALAFTALTTFVTALPFLPYLPESIKMMYTRLGLGVSLQPMHASVWEWPYLLAPNQWSTIKLVVTGAFLLGTTWLILKKRMSPELITACVIFWFVELTLTAGSLDRMNIGITIVILLVGCSDKAGAVLMSAYYIIAGAMMLVVGYYIVIKQVAYAAFDFEIIDATFTFLFLLVFLRVIAGYFFQPRKLEAESSKP